jgi:hypothetical protein
MFSVKYERRRQLLRYCLRRKVLFSIQGGVDGKWSFKDFDQARSEMFSNIDGYYNRVRLHSSLDYKSPLKFEMGLQTKNGGDKRLFLAKNSLSYGNDTQQTLATRNRVQSYRTLQSTLYPL